MRLNGIPMTFIPDPEVIAAARRTAAWAAVINTEDVHFDVAYTCKWKPVKDATPGATRVLLVSGDSIIFGVCDTAYNAPVKIAARDVFQPPPAVPAAAAKKKKRSHAAVTTTQPEPEAPQKRPNVAPDYDPPPAPAGPLFSIPRPISKFARHMAIFNSIKPKDKVVTPITPEALDAAMYTDPSMRANFYYWGVFWFSALSDIDRVDMAAFALEGVDREADVDGKLRDTIASLS